MTLIRTFNADFMNTVVNHPEVRVAAGVPEESPDIDMQPVINNIHNILLQDDGGGFLMLAQGNGCYEQHTQYFPTARGTGPLMALREMFMYMFVRTDCTQINTKVHSNNEKLLGLAHQYFKPTAEHDSYYYFTLSLEEWAARTKECYNRGKAFHWWLGEDNTDHDDDPVHDAQVGAAIFMAEQGNLDKAEHFYNKWALAHGFAPMTIQSVHPTIITVGDLILTMSNTATLEFEKCLPVQQ